MEGDDEEVGEVARGEAIEKRAGEGWDIDEVVRTVEGEDVEAELL